MTRKPLKASVEHSVGKGITGVRFTAAAPALSSFISATESEFPMMSSLSCVQEQVAAVLDNPVRFSRWWQRRSDRNDRLIIAEAVRRGLIVRGNGLVYLTISGKNLRAGEGRGDA